MFRRILTRFWKYILARSMSGYVAENIYTFMLMNTERMLDIHTYRISCHFVSFNEEGKEKK